MGIILPGGGQAHLGTSTHPYDPDQTTSPYTGTGTSGGAQSQLAALVQAMGANTQNNPADQAQQVKIPPYNSSVQQNPQANKVMQNTEAYRQSLAAGNDQDAINAMQRNRDLASGLYKEVSAGALGRGQTESSAGLTAQRQLIAGQQAAGQTNAALTSDARRQQAGLLGQQGNLAIGQAGVTLGQQNYQLQQWQAQQQAAQAAAQLAAMQQQQQYQNQIGLLSSLAPFFTGT